MISKRRLTTVLVLEVRLITVLFPMSPPSGPWVPFLASGALSPGVPMRLSCARGALGNKKLINSLRNIGHLSSEKSLYSLAQEWMNIAKICILTTKRLFGAQASYSILRFCLDLFPLSTPIIIIIHILMARSPMRMPSMQCSIELALYLAESFMGQKFW